MLVAVPLFDRFTSLDAVGAYEVLSFLPDVEVVFVAAERGPVRDVRGWLAMTAGATFDEVESCDLLLVPGGPGTRVLLEENPLLDWIRRMDATSEWTASVCTGSLLLGAAGLLTGLKATTHWASAELLESLGASYTTDRVVFQGKVVTAAGVSAGIDMALALVARLTDELTARAVQLGIEYDPQPPFDSGSPLTATSEIRARFRELAAQRARAS
ncbi:DJ-1/PfpI family protein [Bailinhaonella thermotolerans]|uniref:DJ-1/PfpI family protein n=1 Tax=Bailinhaonella thermotolerans TaxID=1070861 RepID=A0A3A4ASG9_9ACTN|nr:DJ-1/PfpI family protein [Bailinhaonella thermotolerans]RJL32171.1 DJ-1/PfpI family protein [Bailinhaonella thermotolerans]